MINELYTIKSFFSMGDSLGKCYGCDYCRADDGEGYHFHACPSEVNPLFKTLPIAVNLFYGDPSLQADNTMDILRRLEESHHEGVVTIVTKNLRPLDIPRMNLDLHVGISFGTDKLSQDLFEENCETASRAWYKSSIEYRPISNGLNDSDETIERVMATAERYHMSVAYSGLQKPPHELPTKYKPYGTRPFSMQKYLPRTLHEKIKETASKHNVNTFSKTSCLLSHDHNVDRDLNAHYLKPIGTMCNTCPMNERCMGFKPRTDLDLPFKYTITEREDYQCSFVRMGLCKFPSKECNKMKGCFIHPIGIDTMTRGDARVIKWLSGMMLDDVTNLVETPYLSNFWRV